MIRLPDVLAGTSGTAEGNLDSQHLFPNVIHDSRQVKKGDLFVAIKGEHQDGHSFLGPARLNGAAAALVNESWFARDRLAPLPVITVPDTLEALQQLATYWRSLFDIPVIGITGSIGKSSTKEVVAAALSDIFNVHRSAGNYNNEIGLPLSVLQITPETEVLVLEMGGAYAAGEITELMGIAKPQMGIVTNVTHSHLSRMGSLEAIAETKSELVAGLPEDGIAILNIDDSRVSAMSEVARCRVVYYGLEAGADFRATELESLGVDGISFVLSHGNRRDHVQVPLMGLHSVHAALAGIATGYEMGLGLDDILRGLDRPDLQLRLILTPGINGSTLLDDHYNANPKSSFAALALLEEIPARRRIAIFGDMLELGSYARQGHEIVGKRAAAVADLIFTVGDLAKWIAEAAAAENPNVMTSQFGDKGSLVSALREVLQPGDLALIKGSRGVQMETVVEALAEVDTEDLD